MIPYLGLIIAVTVIVGLGGGGFYILWLMTRPPKMTWNALVYQLGEGIKPTPKDANGNIIPNLVNLKLSDLNPYCKDVIERIEKAKGITIYRLQMLNKVTPTVTQDCVDYWGPKDKQVSVLIDGDTCTILKKGFDRAGGIIFSPMPHDRSNMIREEMSIAEERLKKPKDILEAITPWVITGICMLSLVAMSYFMGNAWIESSKHIEAGEKYNADIQLQSAKLYSQAAGIPITPDNTIKREEPPTITT
jgi:hypothetical protein